MSDDPQISQITQIASLGGAAAEASGLSWLMCVLLTGSHLFVLWAMVFWWREEWLLACVSNEYPVGDRMKDSGGAVVALCDRRGVVGSHGVEVSAGAWPAGAAAILHPTASEVAELDLEGSIV